MQSRHATYLWIALIIASAVLFLGNLGAHPFIDYDEATYAQVIKESLADRNYLSFSYFGNDWFEKPPLLFWLSFLSAKIFGLHEFALRLPTALFGMLAIILTWHITFLLTEDRRAAFLASFILLFTGEFAYSARQIRMDVPVTAAILFSVYSFLRGLTAPKWLTGIGIGAALGFLLKNVIGLFSFPILIIFSAIHRRYDWLKNSSLWIGLVLGAGILIPWHAYMNFNFGAQFWNEYMGHHIFNRFANPILGGSFTNTRYLYLLSRLAEPWFLLMPIGIAWFALYADVREKMFSAAASALATAGFIMGVFFIAQTKLFYYLDPIYPFFAIFLSALSISAYDRLALPAYKTIAKGAILIALLGGLISTVWQVFYLRNGFAPDHVIAQEEKIIGEYIAARPENKPIYAIDWAWYETLRYYSGRPIISLPLQDSQEPPRGFFIIPLVTAVSYQDSALRDFFSRATLHGAGEVLTLFEIQ